MRAGDCFGYLIKFLRQWKRNAAAKAQKHDVPLVEINENFIKAGRYVRVQHANVSTEIKIAKKAKRTKYSV